MPPLHLSSQYINSSWEPATYRMSDEEGRGLLELLRFYSTHGPLRKVTTYFTAGGAMPLHVGHGQCYDIDQVLRRVTGQTSLQAQLNRSLVAGGKGHTLSNMLLSTLSEMIERIFGALECFAVSGHLKHGTYRELTGQGLTCLGPRELPLFAPEQFSDPDFPFAPFTEDSQLGWIEGRRLFSGRSIWLPAQLVCIYYPRGRDEARIGYSTTGGLASHISEQEALLHGILELFERDALNISWYSRVAPMVVELDRQVRDGHLRRLLFDLEGMPGRIRFYLHRMDVPEILVMTAIERDEWLTRYAYYAGGAVELDAERCMLSALDEFGQAEHSLRLALAAPQWHFAESIRQTFDLKPDEDARRIDSFLKIVPYYGYEHNAAKMDWYTETSQRVTLSSLPVVEKRSAEEHWRHVVGLLRRQGIDPIVFDFTPSQMKQIRLLKTFIPELTPAFPPAHPLLGHPRYYELPQQLGLADHRLQFSELNTDPMPYP